MAKDNISENSQDSFTKIDLKPEYSTNNYVRRK